MAGYKKRGKKRRTWEKAPRRHAQAAARGWRGHAPKGWRPKRPKWHGSIKSTARARRDQDYSAGRTWSSESERHAQAAARGWNETRKGGWIPKKRGQKKRQSKFTSYVPKSSPYSGSLSSTWGQLARKRGEAVSKKAGKKLGGKMRGTAPRVITVTTTRKPAKKLKGKKGRSFQARSHGGPRITKAQRRRMNQLAHARKSGRRARDW